LAFNWFFKEPEKNSEEKKMFNISDWVIFPEKVVIPIKTCNLYEAYGLTIPKVDGIDAKTKQRFGKYLLDPASFNFEEIRKNNIIMYLSMSPKFGTTDPIELRLFKAALDIAGEESIGTWDPDLKTIMPGEMDADTEKTMQTLAAKVIGINAKNGMAAIALPKQGFEYGNIPQLLSVVMGNYTGMTSAVHGVRLEDMDLPDDYADSFMGPTLGNEGIKKLMGDHITVGTIIKPKTGLSEADFAKACYRSMYGGLDVIKDDENLTSQGYCNFDKRVKLVFEKINELKKETGREFIYVCNITHGDIDEMIRRAELIKKSGGNCLMIDILAVGMTGVQTIRKKFPDMILHGHRAGHGAQTVFPEVTIDGKKYEFRHGISMKVWTLVARLGGIDQLHIGAPKGKMEATHMTVLENYEACVRPLGKLKTMRPIASGGLKATVMWDVARLMNPNGKTPNMDIVFQAGGGTHAHDLGTIAGARSLVQARDAIKAGKSPLETISTHFETLLGFRKWDKEIYGEWVKSLTKNSKIVVDADTRPYYLPGKEKGIAPSPVDLKTAMEKYPPLKEDIQKYNPALLA
jgi:ribulose-bisphosphate carboxylase large chain